MSKRIAFTVHGQVQGVNFRSFTQKKASSYGLTGFVKNTSDDKVVGEAQGDEGSIKRFKSDLNEGPGPARVVKLDIKDIDTKDGEKSFNVSD